MTNNVDSAIIFFLTLLLFLTKNWNLTKWLFHEEKLIEIHQQTAFFLISLGPKQSNSELNWWNLPLLVHNDTLNLSLKFIYFTVTDLCSKSEYKIFVPNFANSYPFSASLAECKNKKAFYLPFWKPDSSSSPKINMYCRVRMNLYWNT